MSPDPGQYADLRQIVMDAVQPIREQIERLYVHIDQNMTRKDVLEPQLLTLHRDIDEINERIDALETKMLGTPQRWILYAASILGLLLSVLELLRYIHV